MSLTVLSIVGTRPEAIKMAPVIKALAERPQIRSLLCATGQHRQMLDQALAVFGLAADVDLDLMRPGQDLFDVTASALLGLRGVLDRLRPDLVLVQGDTTTCLAGAMAAFYRGVPVGHVEAGLRTGRLDAPFPEEGNRSMVGRIAGLHFAPTASARANLIAEAVPSGRIHVTGNTVVDALFMTRAMLRAQDAAAWSQPLGQALTRRLGERLGPVVLITGHRRESFGGGFDALCRAIRDLALAHPRWTLVYPVHLNPNVRRPVFEILAGLDNVFLIEPLDYLPFVGLMDRCDIVLTDSGGIQEEAPSLGKPVLVMREVTERPEAVEAGTVRLVGTDRDRIKSEVEHLLGDPAAYAAMARAHNPYGDGAAAGRIVEVILGAVTASPPLP